MSSLKQKPAFGLYSKALDMSIYSSMSIYPSVEFCVLLFLDISDVGFHPCSPHHSRLCGLPPPCNLQRKRWNESLNDFPSPIGLCSTWETCSIIMHLCGGGSVYLFECEWVETLRGRTCVPDTHVADGLEKHSLIPVSRKRHLWVNPLKSFC